MIKNTDYEIFFGKKPKVSYFRTFGSKCFILNTKDNLGKFDPKADEGIFVGYSNRSKAYTLYNKRTNIIEESLHVSFDENFVTTQINDEEEYIQMILLTHFTIIMKLLIKIIL